MWDPLRLEVPEVVVRVADGQIGFQGGLRGQGQPVVASKWHSSSSLMASALTHPITGTTWNGGPTCGRQLQPLGGRMNNRRRPARHVGQMDDIFQASRDLSLTPPPANTSIPRLSSRDGYIRPVMQAVRFAYTSITE